MRSMATQTDVNNHRNNQRHSSHYPLGSTDYADEKVHACKTLIFMYSEHILKNYFGIIIVNAKTNEQRLL